MIRSFQSVVWLIITFGSYFLSFTGIAVAENQCEAIAPLIEKASTLRELPFKEDPGCELLSSKELSASLMQLTAEDEAQLRHESSFVEAIGLAESAEKYRDCLIGIFRGTATAYYSFERNTIYLPSDQAVSEDVILHELVHALQDQHFPIDQAHKKGPLTSDARLALAALIEGDAFYIQEQFMEKSPEESTDRTTEEETCPEIVHQLDLFPYSWGISYVKRLMRKGGRAAVDAAFKNLPSTTREILTGDRFAARQNSSEKLDSFGQFFLYQLLSSAHGKRKAAGISNMWRGDTLLRGSNDTGLVWEIETPGELESQSFQEAISKSIPCAHPKCSIAPLPGTGKVRISFRG